MATRQTKASILYGVRDLRVQERELPEPANNEVQVAIHTTGLCGSDLHYFNHYRNGDIMVREPMTLGHESAGTVVSVGSSIVNFTAGDRVALEVGLPCEACELCDEGRYNICRGMRFRSSAKAFPHFQGTLQERINHPAKWCHKLPSNVSLELGALAEPLSVAIHARSRATLPQDAAILVLGAGAVGLLSAAVSKAANAKAVIIADIQKDRVDFAVSRGFADAGVAVPLARPETIKEKLAYAREVADLVKATQIRGQAVGEFSVVYECTGVETCVQAATYAAKPGGKVMIIGMGTPILTLPLSAAALREVDLVGVFRYANTYQESIELLSRRPSSMPDLSTLITHRFQGLEEIQDAFSMASKSKDESGRLVIKVVLDLAHKKD